jgi:YVTN family beta-propeller protein
MKMYDYMKFNRFQQMTNGIRSLTFCFLILSTLVASNSIAIFHNNADALIQEDTLESVVSETKTRISPQINVGDGPTFIYGDELVPDFLYVANYISDTVSVIDTAKNMVVGEIRVGKSPDYIYGQLSYLDAIYVANVDSDSVSVINTTTNTLEANIPVGERPSYIYGNPLASDAIEQDN